MAPESLLVLSCARKRRRRLGWRRRIPAGGDLMATSEYGFNTRIRLAETLDDQIDELLADIRTQDLVLPSFSANMSGLEIKRSS